MFDTFIGNKQSIDRLISWVNSKTTTGLLIQGRFGMGLKDLCFEVVKEVLCAPSLDTHPDFVFIEPDDSGKIGVDSIVDVIDKANYSPVKGRCNVALIDGIDKATPQAQNKLLKTLEDAENLVIIGISYSDGVLDTIKSRCVCVPFKPLSEAEFRASYKGNEVDFAYTLSRGCMGQIDDETVMYYKPIAEAISLGEEKELFSILHLVKEKDTESYVNVRKNELPLLLNLLEACYTDLLRYSYLGEVGKIAQPEVISDSKKLFNKAERIREEKRKILMKSYSKDDFFLFICELEAI